MVISGLYLRIIAEKAESGLLFTGSTILVRLHLIVTAICPGVAGGIQALSKGIANKFRSLETD